MTASERGTNLAIQFNRLTGGQKRSKCSVEERMDALGKPVIRNT